MVHVKFLFFHTFFLQVYFSPFFIEIRIVKRFYLFSLCSVLFIPHCNVASLVRAMAQIAGLLGMNIGTGRGSGLSPPKMQKICTENFFSQIEVKIGKGRKFHKVKKSLQPS